MSKRGSVLTWVVAIVLVVLLVAGVGGYVGYRYWMSARAKAAVEAAAAFQEAVWTQDEAALTDLLPPELLAAMDKDDVAGVSGAWSLPCTLEESGWSGDELQADYSTKEWTGAEGTRVDLAANFDLPEPTSARALTVDASFAITGDELPDSLNDTARIDVVWLDGAWRVARYRFEGTYSADVVFYREGRSAEKILTALRTTLGIEPGSAGGFADPVALVSAYYDAIIAGDFPKAYGLLPAEQRSAYGGAEAFEAQLSGYGITSYVLSNVTVDSSDGATVITATATTVAGDFSWDWRLLKEGGKWTAVSYGIAGTDSDASSGSTPELTPDELNAGQLPSGHPAVGGSGN